MCFVLRSKGFAWIANIDDRMCMWGHGGRMLTLDSSQRWFCELEDSEWGVSDAAHFENIYGDFEAPHGDRRQAIVFIGSDLNQEAIESSLLECLMLEEEIQDFNRLLLPSVGSEVVKTTKTGSKHSKMRVKTEPSAVSESTPYYPWLGNCVKLVERTCSPHPPCQQWNCCS